MKTNSQSKKTKLDKVLHGLFGSRRKKVVVTCVILSLLIVGSGLLLLHFKNYVSDTDKANDLAKIQITVVAGLAKNNKLPESLHLESLGLTNLKGKLDDYTYTSDVYENGSPTQSYVICATFHTQTIKLPITDGTESFSSDGGAQAYKQHRKGKQCFTNHYYKDGSHVNLIYKSGEVSNQ